MADGGQKETSEVSISTTGLHYSTQNPYVGHEPLKRLIPKVIKHNLTVVDQRLLNMT